MAQFAAPPVRTPYTDPQTPGGSFSRGWTQWFQAITNRFNNAPTITGSRSNPATFTALLTALDQAGIIVDKTTP